MIEEENTEQENEEIVDEVDTQAGEVDVQITEPTEAEELVEDIIETQKDFLSNLAEDMDERILSRISGDLLEDYKRDKESRGDWEKSYTSGLDLLGFKYDNES